MKHTYRRRISAAALLALMISSSVAPVAVAWPKALTIKQTDASTKMQTRLTVGEKAPKATVFTDKNYQITAGVATVLAILVNHMVQSAVNELMAPDRKGAPRSTKQVAKDIALAMVNPRKLAKVGLGSFLAALKGDSNRDVPSTVLQRLYKWFMANKVYTVLTFAELAGAAYFLYFREDSQWARYTEWNKLAKELDSLTATTDLQLDKNEATLAAARAEQAKLVELDKEAALIGTGTISAREARKTAREALVGRADELKLVAATATAEEFIAADLRADLTEATVAKLTAKQVAEKLHLLSLLSSDAQKEFAEVSTLLTARNAEIKLNARKKMGRAFLAVKGAVALRKSKALLATVNAFGSALTVDSTAEDVKAVIDAMESSSETVQAMPLFVNKLQYLKAQHAAMTADGNSEKFAPFVVKEADTTPSGKRVPATKTVTVWKKTGFVYGGEWKTLTETAVVVEQAGEDKSQHITSNTYFLSTNGIANSAGKYSYGLKHKDAYGNVTDVAGDCWDFVRST